MDGFRLYIKGFSSHLPLQLLGVCRALNARGAVVIIARTRADETLLVEQYRAPMDASVIEFPAG